jgi:glucokinase
LTDQDQTEVPDGRFFVAGVDIGGTNLRVALAGDDGEIVSRRALSTVGIREPEQVVRLICDAVDELLAEQSASRNALRALAAGAPGITNADTGLVIATSYLLGWRDVPLRGLLEEALGVPAAVDNDVNLAALGESWRGAAADGAARDFVFLAIGTGLGAGIVLNSQLFRGTGWTAGEIGYMMLPGTPGDPAERGQPGALESRIGGNGIQEQWKELWDPSRTPLPRNLIATEIFDHALAGDELAQSLLQNAGHLLACAIYNISLVLNCPLFVLGGSVGMHPAISSSAAAFLERWGSRVQPQLKLSKLGTDAQLFGAIRLALDLAPGLPPDLASQNSAGKP